MTHDVMTEADKHAELDRQIRKGDTIFCPWCGGINQPDTSHCCRAFSAGLEKRGEDQLKLVIDQYTAVEVGLTDSITCPYCGQLNSAPSSESDGPRHPSGWKRPMVSPFCCDLFGMAVYAIVERKRTQACLDHAERIGEAALKAAKN